MSKTKIKGFVRPVKFMDNQKKNMASLVARKKKLHRILEKRDEGWLSAFHEISKINLKIEIIKSRIANYKKPSGIQSHYVPTGTQMSY